MKKKRKSILSYIIILIVVFLILFPVATMILWVFTERWAWPDLFPQVFSMRALDQISARGTELSAVFASSAEISVVVASFSVVVALMTARAVVLYDFPGKQLIYFLTILPFMIPVTVLAMGLQVLFIKLGLNNAVTGVILIHLIASLPYAVRLLIDGTQAVGNRLEEQARVLGASAWKAFFHTTLPMLVPVMLSSFCMAYIVSFSQYFMTLLIGGGKVKTFTVVMVPYLQSGNRNIACVYSVIFLGVTLILFSLFEGLAKHWTKENSGGFYES